MRQEVAAALHETAESIEACVAILERMGERCDPYIYNERVRTFMSGWTHEAMPPEGLAYEGILAAPTETTSPAPSAPSLSRTSLGFKLKSIMKRFQRAPSTESPAIGLESADCRRPMDLVKSFSKYLVRNSASIQPRMSP